MFVFAEPSNSSSSGRSRPRVSSCRDDTIATGISSSGEESARVRRCFATFISQLVVMYLRVKRF